MRFSIAAPPTGGVEAAEDGMRRERRLTHQALVYGSAEDLAVRAAPFLRAGMAHGDTLLAATKPENIEALRAELGADAERVAYHDTARWHTRPADRLNVVRRLADSVPPGAQLCALGEPVWQGSDAALREWARYESVINVALADAPLRFVCLYDGARLSDELLRYAPCTHPELLENGHAVASPDYVDPEEFVRGTRLGPTTLPDSPIAEIAFDGDHAAFRSALGDTARQRGLSPDRAEELVIAANEVSSNAVVHGDPPVRARAWTSDGDFICEVSDSGPGLTDPLAGWSSADRPDPGGWGLALSRRLCDAIEIVPDPLGGTRVYLHMALAG